MVTFALDADESLPAQPAPYYPQPLQAAFKVDAELAKAGETQWGERACFNCHGRDVIAAGLNDIEGIHCPLPEGTFYAFAQFDSAWGDSRELAVHLLENAGVLLTPGTAYGPASPHHLRFSFATSVDLIEAGMARLKAALPPP